MALSKWLNQPLSRFLGLSLKPDSPSRFEKLPTELIVVIFHHVISSFQPPPRASSWVHIQNLLSQVSKRWRAIVTSIPFLWTYVPIMPGQPIDVLQLFLQKSSSLPISVTVYPWPVLPNHVTIISLDRQIRTLLAAQTNCERIVSLRIEATGLDDLVDRVARHWLEACHERQTSALRNVSLKGASHTVWHGSQFFDRAVAPALSTLFMEDIPIGWFEGPPKDRSPPNLTTVVWKHTPNFDKVSLLEFCQFVSAFPSLKTVELDGPIVDFEVPLRLESKLGVLRLASGLLDLRSLWDSDNEVHITDESRMWRSLRELLVSGSPAPLHMPLSVQPAPLAVL